MPIDWGENSLGHLTDNFDALRVPVREADRRPGPYPYYGASGIVDYVEDYLFDGEYLLIAEDGENLRSRTTPIAFLARGKFWVNNHAHVVRGNHNADTRFLMYSLAVTDISGYLTGSTIPKLTQGNMNRIPLLTPPLGEQRAIAHILDTLDDKIELNRRTTETLEATARALFKSWFVDFDPVVAKREGRDAQLPTSILDLFPDHFVHSSIGIMPAGWVAGRLEDALSELVSGSRPQGGAIEQGVPSIGAENVIGLGRYDFSKEKFIPREFYDHLKRKGAAVRPGDILLYKDGAQIGRKTYFDCGFPHDECAVNEHVFIVRTKRPQQQRFLFFWLEQSWVTQAIISLNSNSAQPGINQRGIRGLPLLLPPHELVDAFDRIASPVTRRLFTSCNENRTLVQLRDTLLPKLVSGELRVKDVDRVIAAAI